MSAAVDSDQLVRERAMASSRVRQVLAAGIQALARHDLGIELTTDEAWELAQAGSLSQPILQLRQRLTLRRAHPLTTLDETSQHRVAVAEVAADLSGLFADDPEGRFRYVRDLVERAAIHQQERRRLDDDARRIETLLAELERIGGSSYRRFVRRVTRLWSDQRSTLHAVIIDADTLQAVEQRLEQVYLRHLRQIITIE